MNNTIYVLHSIYYYCTHLIEEKNRGLKNLKPAQGHRNNKWQSWDPTTGSLAAVSAL